MSEARRGRTGHAARRHEGSSVARAGAKRRKGLLVVISGPSGSGKTTIARALEDRLGVKRSISATTRPIRDGEKEGEDYRFLRRKEFQDRIASGGFVEHAQYAGEFYGTPRAPLEAAISRGETVLLSIDVQGARSIRVAFPDAVTIFVRPPSLEEAKRRLMGRHREREAEIDRRMEIACKELECAGEFDYQVVNDDLDTAIDETAKIITRARAGRS